MISNNKKIITNSMAASFLKCEMRCYWQYIQGLKLKAFHFPFVVGEAGHEAVQHLYKTKGERLKHSILRGKSILRTRKQQYIRTTAPLSPGEDQEFENQITMMEAMISAYAFEYEDTIPKFNVILQEQVFYKKIPQTSWTMGSKIDQIFIDHNNDLFIHEFKFKKTMSIDSIEQYRTDPQLMTYTWVISPKYRVKGVVIDCVKKPGIRLKKNEQEPEFLERLMEYYLSQNDAFYQNMFPKNKQYLSDNLQTLQAVCKRLDHAIKTQQWIKNRNQCGVYGKCEFLALCNYGPNPMTLLKYTKKITRHEELENRRKEK